MNKIYLSITTACAVFAFSFSAHAQLYPCGSAQVVATYKQLESPKSLLNSIKTRRQTVSFLSATIKLCPNGYASDGECKTITTPYTLNITDSEKLAKLVKRTICSNQLALCPSPYVLKNFGYKLDDFDKKAYFILNGPDTMLTISGLDGGRFTCPK